MVTIIYSGKGKFLKKYAKIFTALSVSIINLFVNQIFIQIYKRVAYALTDLEKPRTQVELIDSYTFKMFLFECVNFYSSLIYIAFFKGTFYKYPGDDEARRSTFLRLKMDRCASAGCLSELSVMLTILMVGKQTFKSMWKIGLLWMKNCVRRLWHRAHTLDRSKPYMPWEKDYQLQDPGEPLLFKEYLEMIMQYGFVTLFVAACPLVPLFALLHSVYGLRLDAYKFLTQSRLPLVERVEDIGAWRGILQFLTYMSVVSNAFVIAYTSDFVPRMVYLFAYAPNGTLVGYINYSLSWFNTSDYLEDWGAGPTEWDPPQCAYRGYRNPPEHPEPYDLSPYYWHVFAARLAFVVVFEHVVFSLTELMHWLVSPMPHELQTQIKRETLVEKEMMFGHDFDNVREGTKEWRRKKHMEYLKSRMDRKAPETVGLNYAGVKYSRDDKKLQKTANLTIDEDL